jgi:hypothetical protein
MPLQRSDLDQAVRYLQHARVLLEGLPGARMRAIRDVMDLAIRRLSPGDFYAGDAAAEITLLRDIAGKLSGDARTDILKAVAILIDRGAPLMRILTPTARDLSDTDLAIRSFSGAYGSVSSEGQFRPSAADHRMLAMFIPVTVDTMTNLWRVSGIATDGKSSFATMQSAPDHCVDVYFFKLRRGWFRAIWVGNVKFNFGKLIVNAGCVAGATQAEMWQHLRNFIEGDGSLYNSTDAAVAAVTGH